MSWWMGAGLGFLRGGPLGAVVGGSIEYFLGKNIQKKVQESLPGIHKKSDFITCLVIILTRAGSVKGVLKPKQLAVIHKFFLKNLHFRPVDLKTIDPLIREVQNKKPDLEPIVEEYKKSCQNNYNLLLLALSYQISLVGNSFGEDEETMLKQLAQLLDVSYEQHNKIREKYFLEILKTPYHVLEIPPDSSNDVVKKAYRRLMSVYHPDRVAYKGEKAVEAAHLKFLEIQAAYNELEMARGI